VFVQKQEQVTGKEEMRRGYGEKVRPRKKRHVRDRGRQKVKTSWIQRK
jgi:hypothetical protein